MQKIGTNMRIFKYVSFFMVFAVALIYIHQKYAPYRTFHGKIFGTYYHVKILTDRSDRTLGDKILRRLQDVNRQMSVFEKNSEISKINQSPAGNKIGLSPEMSYLLKNAAAVNRESGGAFDPTVGRLVDLWGFGVDKPAQTPDPEKIKEALTYTGFNRLVFSSDFKSLSKTDDRIRLNLSAIAKGYGVDMVARLLEEEGYRDYIVEIGGEVRAAGRKNSAGEPWSIGIAKPSPQGNSNAFALELTDFSVATSGDYRNFFYKDGRRYAHTISPQTGYPVEHSLASVTVFHPSCMMADAYATAILALGEDEGMTFADAQKLPAVFFVRRNDNSVTMLLSTAAKDLIGE